MAKNKEKRINLIIKAKGLVEAALGLKERKIKRAVAAAWDYAIDQQLNAESRKLQALNDMGKYADNPEKLKASINDYCEACDLLENWKVRETQVKALTEALEEEVEVPEE